MTQLSDFSENGLLDLVLRGDAFAAPANRYAALHTADPTDEGTGAEVSGGGYARQAITFGAPASRAVTTTANLQWTADAANFGTITHIGIWDALTDGNLLCYKPLSQSELIEDGDQYAIASGDLTCTFSAGAMTDFLAHELLDHLLRGNAYTPPAQPYGAIYTSADTTTEVSGGGYARQAVDFDAASDGSSANSVLVDFAASGADFGNIQHFALIDAATSGNILFDNNLTAAKQINDGSSLPFNAGTITPRLQ